MGKMYWVRVAMMILTFTVVVVTIRNLQSTKPTSSPIAEMLMGTKGAAPSAVEKSVITICPTRVTWLELSDGTRIHQEGIQWWRTHGNDKTELDADDMEKWLGGYCSFKGLAVPPCEKFQPLLKVGYVSGEPQVLEGCGAEVYRWQGQVFAAVEVRAGLGGLANMPARKAPGTK